MKRSCWRLFSYLFIDHQAAQDFLNRMATKGWELDHLLFGLFAKFKRTDRTDLSYFLDWTDPSFDESPDYVQLCADAGWDLILNHRYWNIYASHPGVSPSPIQTDSHVEYQRFCKKALRRMFIGAGMAVLSLFLVFLWARCTQSDLSMFQNIRYQEELLSRSLLTSLLLFLIPLALLGMLFYCVMLLRRLLFWRKHNSSTVISGIPGTVLKLLSAAAVFLFLLSGIADVLINGFSVLHIFYNLFFGYLLLSGNGRQRKSRQHRFFRSVILLIVLSAACAFLHYPIQAYLPQRIPVTPIFENSDMEYMERYDTLLGSYLDWLEGYQTSEGATNTFSCTVYSWISPILSDHFLQSWSENAEPIPGYENIWRIGRYTVIARGCSYLALTGHEPEAVPIDEALLWLEGWALP